MHPRPNVLYTPVNHPTDGPTRNLKAVLANPYAQTASSSSYSSHYLQAYLQSGSGPSGWHLPNLNAQGYTLSSTYRPENQRRDIQPNNHRNGIPFPNSSTTRPFHHHSPSSGQWYQSGNARCAYRGCVFTGSQKSLEIHRMDRHLVYPPGWEHKQRKGDWDADPSLKGKVIPIQGTNINLDSPEVLEAWLAERKRRWPSTSRVEGLKKKLEEAAARGQLSIHETARFGKRKYGHLDAYQNQQRADRKKRNVEMHGKSNAKDVPIHRRNGAGNRRKGFVLESNLTPQSPALVATTSPQTSPVPQDVAVGLGPISSSEDEDGPPKVVSSKAPLSAAIEHAASHSETALDQSGQTGSSEVRRAKPLKIQPPRPPKEPFNPFVSRPSLFRNLLLPEIRMTVSNLSQAIRFLVDNDFLAGVELEPGEAHQRLIQVIE